MRFCIALLVTLLFAQSAAPAAAVTPLATTATIAGPGLATVVVRDAPPAAALICAAADLGTDCGPPGSVLRINYLVTTEVATYAFDGAGALLAVGLAPARARAYLPGVQR